MLVETEAEFPINLPYFKTEFQNAEFDAVITRNLTWTLPHADAAYAEWIRILKPGGVLINTDADYAHNQVDDAELPPLHAHHLIGKDMNIENAHIMRSLPISNCHRPKWDMDILRSVGIAEENIHVDTAIADRIYLSKDELYNPAPIFLIAAYKQ